MILRTLQQKGAFSSVLNFPGHFFKSVPKMQEESRNTTLIKCPSQRPSESPCVPFVRGHSSFAQTQHFTSKDESSVTVSELKHTLRVGEKILFFPSWKKESQYLQLTPVTTQCVYLFVTQQAALQMLLKVL